MTLPITDTRAFFRPMSLEIVTLLRALPAGDWERPAVGTWRVRDVAAHLIDTAARRLSCHRDGHLPPAPPSGSTGEGDLTRFINDLNAIWVRASQRLSPRVLTDAYASASRDLADFVESLPLQAPACFAVSWAEENRSAGWLDIGREFAEVWHHGTQIRESAGAGPFSNPQWLGAVLRVALHAVPHAYRDVPARPRTEVAIEVSGSAGGIWTLERLADRWAIGEGQSGEPVTRATMSDDAAWRLFFNGLSPEAAASAVRVDGDAELGRPLLGARAIIV